MIKEIRRLECSENRIGNIDVFYALYKVETDEGEVYAVAVGEDDSISAVTLRSRDDGIRLYRTVSENDVGEVSFFDIADDFLYEKQYIVMS